MQVERKHARDALLERCKAIPTPAWSDALDPMGVGGGVLDGLVRRAGDGQVSGLAVTVIAEVGRYGSFELEDFSVGGFIDSAGPGDVVFVSLGKGAQISTLGGLAATRAVRGIEGIVIDGGCRDIEELRELGLTVVSRHVTPLSGKRRVRFTAFNEPVACGEVTVGPGDLIVVDATGTVVVPRPHLPEALAKAEELAKKDAAFQEAIVSGGSFTEAAIALGHS